jgi:hypothetical protein
MTTESHTSASEPRMMWVFNHAQGGAGFSCGVCSSRERAERWIADVGAAGTLSAYIVDESAYDSAVRLGRLRLDLGKRPRDTPEFKRSFTTAVDHFHYGVNP